MTVALSQVIETIRRSSPACSLARNKVAKVVAAVEKFLNNECNLGMSVHYVYERHEVKNCLGNLEPKKSIGYDWHNGKYQIVVTDYSIMIEPTDDPAEYTAPVALTDPWSYCDRDTKMAAFRHLPALLKAIADEAAKRIVTPNDDASTVSEIMAAIADNGGGRAS